MPFGKHSDKLIERIVIEAPDYVHWFYSEGLGKSRRDVNDIIAETIALLDEKPFSKARCSGRVDGNRCSRTPTRMAIIPTSRVLTFWCDSCDPCNEYSADSIVLRKYREVVKHMYDQKYYAKTNSIAAIRQLVEAKGMPHDMSDADIVKFLYGPDAIPYKIKPEE